MLLSKNSGELHSPGQSGAAVPTRALRYHVAVHSLAQRVLSQIREQELLKAGDRVGIAVSGGIDSVALLRLLLELRHELGIVLSVVHFNHKLRGAESDVDQEFVAALARAHDLEFHADGDDVAQHAAEERVSVETAARELRYGFFRYLIQEICVEAPNAKSPTSRNNGETWGTPGDSSSSQRRGIINKIATGHTLDDQAETVLMRMIRGTGMTGLGGVHPRIAVEDDDGEICGELVRPLLGVRRRELERYLKDIGQSWREDATNADAAFTRNRVRKLVIPVLEKEFNPAVAENLAELAEIARGEEDYWENEAAGWMGTTVQWSEPDWAGGLAGAALVQIAPAHDAGHARHDDLRSRIAHASWLVMNASVSRMWLLSEPLAVQRRLLKAIGEHARIPLEFKHVEEILRFAAESRETGKEIALPLGWKVIREPDELLFLTPDLREPRAEAVDYEYELTVPGRVEVPEAGLVIEAKRVRSALDEAGYNPEHLLDAESVPGPLRVRNWRPGDRFWPAHTRSAKKIKELLQELHVDQPQRRLWPVVVSRTEGRDEIVWVRGFRSGAKFQAKPGREAILIVDWTPAAAAVKSEK
jgi:tRNA(Ile)-lysidine synthase